MIASALLGSGAWPLLRAQSTWDGGAGSSNYGASGNWNPNGVPGNVLISFDGADANGQFLIDLSGNRTVTGIQFISAVGPNAFTFKDNRFTIGSNGILNSDDDTQTFQASLDFRLSSPQSWTATTGGLDFFGLVDNQGNLLTISGAGEVLIDGRIDGTGGLTKNGTGDLLLGDSGNRFSGGFIQNAGRTLINPSGNVGIASLGADSYLGRQAITLNGGTLEFSPTGDFNGFNRSITIDGGTLLLNPGGSVAGLMNAGTLDFAINGGLLDIARQLNPGVLLGSVNVGSAALTPGVIRYSTIAANVGAGGWNSGGRDLNIVEGNLTGSGTLKFELHDGALLHYSDSAFSGSLIFNGVSGGNAQSGVLGTAVGRLALDGAANFDVTGGLTFEEAMQVTAINGNRTIRSGITIASGETAFQGRSAAAVASDDLILGETPGSSLLTVKNGAIATLDARFRDDAANNNVGGVKLNANTILEAGATLNFRKSATVVGETVEGISVAGDITGQGTTASESTVKLGLAGGAGGVNFATGSGSAGTDLIVNGSGLGGLRIEGSKAAVDNLLIPQVFQDLTGTGGTLTVAYNDNGVGTFYTAPSVASHVKLGFDDVSGNSPVYNLGVSANDLAKFNGLVVQGGTVNLMVNQAFTGAGTTTLDLAGGSLVLRGGGLPRQLTIEGDANLTGGNLNGGVLVGTEGTLVVGGSIISSGTLLVNKPNITMNGNDAEAVTGATPLTGIGRFTKNGTGSVTLDNQIGAVNVDINNGTLLLGADQRINDTAAVRLAGGTLATGGFDETVGALTLANNSVIDLGAGSSILQFADSSANAWTAGRTLTVANWNGDTAGGGNDQLRFGNSFSALTAGQVAQIRFQNPNGVLGLYAAQILSSGEVVPVAVPEPATVATVALLLGSLGWRERKFLGRFFSKR
ncbi:MAG: hypothetical protein SFY81_02120 [Verrucomicrobiota bacterium]|nr:hypothetical protein [Verrucomicrobiota bacterium]